MGVYRPNTQLKKEYSGLKGAKISLARAIN